MGKLGSQLSSDEVWCVMEEVSRTKFEVEIDKDVSRRGRHDCQPAKSTAPTIVTDSESDACEDERKVEWEGEKNQGQCPAITRGKSLLSCTNTLLHHTVWGSVSSQVFADLRIAIVSRFVTSTRSVDQPQHDMSSR
jgi:hypothetical protein